MGNNIIYCPPVKTLVGKASIGDVGRLNTNNPLSRNEQLKGTRRSHTKSAVVKSVNELWGGNLLEKIRQNF